MTEPITFTLDGRSVQARPGETIWQVAARYGITIPHLCWLPEPGYRADGNCRACMVEIEGERTLAASCIRKPTPGMVVRTDSARAVHARKMVMELLLADQPPRADAHDRTSRLWSWAERLGLEEAAFRHAAKSRRLTGRIRRWSCSWTPAFTAACACGRAARCRSTT